MSKVAQLCGIFQNIFLARLIVVLLFACLMFSFMWLPYGVVNTDDNSNNNNWVLRPLTY